MKIGVVGNGMIVQRALNSLQEARIPCRALWCRNQEHGRPLIQKYGIENLYIDYPAFLQDSSFDTVYIGIVNSLHYSYALEALQSGKNVIVEKPFTSTLKEAEELARTARERNLFLFEAIKTRYTKNYQIIQSHLKDIGRVCLGQINYSKISSRYDSYKEKKVHPVFDPAMSGGALKDLNVYGISFLTGLFGVPENAVYYPNIGYNGIDTSGILVMDYGNWKAVSTAAKDSASTSGILLQGEKGTIEIRNHPGWLKNIVLRTKDGNEKVLDDHSEAAPMTVQFIQMQEAMEHKNYELVNRWLNMTLDTMTVLAMAEKKTELPFPQ